MTALRTRKHRVLIVNAYFDPWRVATPTRLFVPRAMAPYFLAGHFEPATCDVRVWDEAFHGALLDPKIFEWPDVLVLSGLTVAFDRARQLSAYVRAANPRVVVVIGGPIARALPALCSKVFDYICMGDTEEIADVAEAVLGQNAVLRHGAPRMDLTTPKMGLGYLETTRNCNFACAFCSLTGENQPYVAYSDEAIEAQLDAMGKVTGVMLLDNNFYGSNRMNFERRVEALGRRWKAGQFKAWAALVTGDFFKRPRNLELVAENGCAALFSGVESLDSAILKSFNKKQSLVSEPLALTETCAAHGVQFDYGLIIDFAQQTLEEVDAQVESLVADHRVPLPALLSMTIPILGTPYFNESAAAGRLMPNVLLSDMDGQKLVEWPKEPVEKVVPFFRDMLRMKGRKRALAGHVVRHAWHWRQHLRPELTAMSLLRPLHRFGPRMVFGSLAQMRQTWREPKLTYSAMSDQLRLAYTPVIPMPDRFAQDFKPLAITDANGQLTDDVMAAQEKPRIRAT